MKKIGKNTYSEIPYGLKHINKTSVSKIQDAGTFMQSDIYPWQQSEPSALTALSYLSLLFVHQRMMDIHKIMLSWLMHANNGDYFNETSK